MKEIFLAAALTFALGSASAADLVGTAQSAGNVKISRQAHGS